MAHALERDLVHVLERTESLWDTIAGANVFITGGTGFVGSWLLESFVWANKQLNLRARMFVLTRDPEKFRADKPQLAREACVHILHGDLETFQFPAQEFHYVIHAAAESGCAQRVLEMAKTSGTRRVLYTSSGAVYGEQPTDIENLDEEFVAPIECCTPYGRAKRETETLCVRAADAGLGVVIGRLFAFVGPYLPLEKNFAVGNFVRDARQGGPIEVEGDGTPLRSYLYAADLAIWLWTLLIKGSPGRPYNVGSDQAISILDLARTVERVCGVKRGIRVALKSAIGAKPKRYVPAIARGREELRLEPWIGLEEGIRRMFQFSMK
jgi:dTDP-glucose 4,6-dehydratase